MTAPKLTHVAVVSLLAMAIPGSLASQENQSQNKHNEHHQYKPVDSNTEILSGFDGQLQDLIDIIDRSEIAASLGLTHPICPKFACTVHSVARVCTGRGPTNCLSRCPFPHHGLSVGSYDFKYHRSCYFCVCT